MLERIMLKCLSHDVALSRLQIRIESGFVTAIALQMCLQVYSAS